MRIASGRRHAGREYRQGRRGPEVGRFWARRRAASHISRPPVLDRPSLRRRTTPWPPRQTLRRRASRLLRRPDCRTAREPDRGRSETNTWLGTPESTATLARDRPVLPGAFSASSLSKDSSALPFVFNGKHRKLDLSALDCLSIGAPHRDRRPRPLSCLPKRRLIGQAPPG